MLMHSLPAETDGFRGFRAIGAGRHAVAQKRSRPGGETRIEPTEAVSRRAMIADGITAVLVEVPANGTLDVSFEADRHTLVVYEQGARREGETFVEGVGRSALHELGRKLTIVPAGHRHRDRHAARTPTRIMYLAIDPTRLPQAFRMEGEVSVQPRMFFEDASLHEAALKLKRSLEGRENPVYVEALGIVLVHELVRAARGRPAVAAPARGGLAAWQQRAVTAYIDAHLDEPIPLATLAGLARLSTYHFCRAFKQSLGMPPHRYHTARRIEHAKALLAERSDSVTGIGFAIGYGEPSSFTAAFRKATGLSPSAWQRSLG